MHLRVRAGTVPEVLEEAGRALAELLLRGRRRAAPGSWAAVELQSTDPAALLVDWLNELIWRAEVERCVPLEYELEQVGESAVRGRIRGIPVRKAPALVKAATLHGARLETVGGGFEGDVILDV